jgi:hypothetical protein
MARRNRSMRSRNAAGASPRCATARVAVAVALLARLLACRVSVTRLAEVAGAVVGIPVLLRHREAQLVLALDAVGREAAVLVVVPEVLSCLPWATL